MKVWNDVRPPQAPELILEDGDTARPTTIAEFVNQENSVDGPSYILLDEGAVRVNNGRLASTDVRYRYDGQGVNRGPARFVMTLTGDPLSTRGLPADWTVPTLRHVLAHEFGHVLGLDHAQLPLEPAPDDATAPLMFPLAQQYDSLLTGDDAASLLGVYDAALSPLVYGRIRGSVMRTAATPQSNLNVVAVPIDPRERAIGEFSGVSGYLGVGGEYSIWLPPGRYRIFVEPIRFAGEEGVGPTSHGLLVPRNDLQGSDAAVEIGDHSVNRGITVDFDIQLPN